MGNKFDYTKGYCSKFKVFGFWPVQAVREKGTGRYRHEAMACDQYGSEGCAKESCRVLAECEEYVDQDREWLLKDKKL